MNKITYFFTFSYFNFHIFLARSLRRKGMRKVLQRLDNVCFKTIKKAIAMLEKSPITYAEVVENKNKQQSVDYTMVHLSSSRSSYFYAFYFPTFSF